MHSSHEENNELSQLLHRLNYIREESLQLKPVLQEHKAELSKLSRDYIYRFHGFFQDIESALKDMLYGTTELITAARDLDDIINIEQPSENNELNEPIDNSNDFLDSVISNISEGISVYNEALECLVWNRFMGRLTGINEKEALGKHAFDLLPEMQDYAFDSLLEEALMGKIAYSKDIKFFSNKLGFKGYYRATFSPLLSDSDDVISGVIMVIHDITHDINRDDSIKESNNEEQVKIRESDEIIHETKNTQSVERLARGISHELNNILTVIKGHLSMAMENQDKIGIDNRLKKVDEAVCRVEELVHQLQAFSGRQIINMGTIDLNRLIGNLQVKLSHIAGDNIEIHMSLQDDLETIYADPNQMKQVITNLVANARDNMLNSGDLYIETSMMKFDEDHFIENPNFPTGEYIMIKVSDTGQGMDKELMDHIFEPYFAPDGKVIGDRGLNLAVVYNIIRQFNGYIDLSSENGHGTSFSIYLPRAGEAEDIKQESVKGNETILFVDDDESISKLTSHFLGRLGYNVLVAKNGTQALEIANNHKGSIHLLLTDVGMPGMNGIQLAEQLSIIYPETKILYTSGSFDAKDIVPGENPNFISKPYDLSILSRKIREILS